MYMCLLPLKAPEAVFQLLQNLGQESGLTNYNQVIRRLVPLDCGFYQCCITMTVSIAYY